jgi:hypothetical protein
LVKIGLIGLARNLLVETTFSSRTVAGDRSASPYRR